MVRAVEAVAITDAIGTRKTQAHIAERDSLAASGNVHRTRETDGLAIGRNALNMSDGGDRESGQPGGIHHGNAMVEREPDPARRIADHRPMPLDPFEPAQAVRQTVFVNVLFFK